MARVEMIRRPWLEFTQIERRGKECEVDATAERNQRIARLPESDRLADLAHAKAILDNRPIADQLAIACRCEQAKCMAAESGISLAAAFSALATQDRQRAREISGRDLLNRE